MPDETFTGVKVLSFRKMPLRPMYRLRLLNGQQEITIDYPDDASEETQSALSFLRNLKGHTVTIAIDHKGMSLTRNA